MRLAADAAMPPGAARRVRVVVFDNLIDDSQRRQIAGPQPVILKAAAVCCLKKLDVCSPWRHSVLKRNHAVIPLGGIILKSDGNRGSPSGGYRAALFVCPPVPQEVPLSLAYSNLILTLFGLAVGGQSYGSANAEIACIGAGGNGVTTTGAGQQISVHRPGPGAPGGNLRQRPPTPCTLNTPWIHPECTFSGWKRATGCGVETVAVGF